MQFERPPAMEDGSHGFIAARPDRPERLALYRPDGTLSNSFASSDTVESIMATPWCECMVPVKGRRNVYLVWIKPQGSN